MMEKSFKWVGWLVILAPVALLAYEWNRLPDQVAMHFDINGEPDRYGSKAEFLLGMSVLLVISVLIYQFLPQVYKIDPKKTAPENRVRLEKLSFAIVVVLSFISCLIIYSVSGNKLRLNMRLLSAVLGALWCVVGNYLYTIKPNYFAGLRLPWTLNDEENWKKTHALAGKLFFGAGLLMMAASLVPSRNFSMIFFIVMAAISVIIPIIYSYRLYRQSLS